MSPEEATILATALAAHGMGGTTWLELAQALGPAVEEIVAKRVNAAEVEAWEVGFETAAANYSDVWPVPDADWGINPYRKDAPVAPPTAPLTASDDESGSQPHGDAAGRSCPDHPAIPRADCACPYDGEEPL